MKFYIIYLCAVSLLAVILTVVDKLHAVHRKSRVPELTLMLVSALGGSAAMLVTMLVIRHKTRHPKFMIGIPVMILIQAAAVILIARFFYV